MRDAWHILDACGFCPHCPFLDQNACEKAVQLASEYDMYALICWNNGITWLAPRDHCYRGHSAFRIIWAIACQAANDPAGAAWVLARPHLFIGPEVGETTDYIRVDLDGVIQTDGDDPSLDYPEKTLAAEPQLATVSV